MSKINSFYKDGVIDFKCKYKPILGRPIVYVEDKLWYKFQIDELYEYDDTYIASSKTLLGIDGEKYRDR